MNETEHKSVTADRATSDRLTRAEVEQFLVDEAVMLDEWRLQDWLELMTDEVMYLVPSLDSPDSDHRSALFLISDNAASLRSRVGQLLGDTAWAENPRSRTRRMLTNFRVIADDGDVKTIGANFAVWRFQYGKTDVYVGRYVSKVVRTDEGLKYVERRAILDLEVLRPHGKLSFVL